MTVGALLLLTGPPEFRATGPLAGSALPAATAPFHGAGADADPTEVREAESGHPAPQDAAAADAPAGQASAAVPMQPPETAEASRAPVTGPSSAPSEHAGPPAPDIPANDPDRRWHSFWNPFRSEIAASGFAARLRRVTGIDYRVVRLEPGSYQVAFAYADDDERRSKISQIERATGLDLPEQAPCTAAST
ncbi:MAG: hypothetical protein ACE5FS_16015 [Paracoccaceae bacterium]